MGGEEVRSSNPAGTQRKCGGFFVRGAGERGVSIFGVQWIPFTIHKFRDWDFK